jgi:geranylgeranyl pyrophosphate synthase
MPKERLMEKAISIMFQRGQKAVELARLEVLQEKVTYRPLQDALKYFIEDWNDFLHPALLSLACEAVGGDPKLTEQVGSAIVLLAGGADIHDDIIDKSLIKEPRQTVFGKFGEDIAILAGDTLLLKGLYLLNDACDQFPKIKRREILGIIKDAFLESSSAEALEASLRGKTEIGIEDFLCMIKQKVATAEAVTRIGSVLGNGTKKETVLLGNYGRTFGILMALRDEFVDTYEIDELMNRAQKEILPLPILLAFDNEKRKNEILRLIQKQINEEDVDKILELTMNSEKTCDLVKFMNRLVKDENLKLKTLVKNKAELKLLLHATLEDL